MTDIRETDQAHSVAPPPLPQGIGETAVHPAFLPEAPYRIPAERYTSAEFAALENERLWPRVWQVACSVDHVSTSGDAVDCRLGPLSALVVRGSDGRLRAFQNVCRHRGNTICEGNRRGLTELRCPYHRWAWDLDGGLREVPSRRGFGALPTGELGLVPVSVDQWGPLVFVNFDPAAAPCSTGSKACQATLPGPVSRSSAAWSPPPPRCHATGRWSWTVSPRPITYRASTTRCCRRSTTSAPRSTSGAAIACPTSSTASRAPGYAPTSNPAWSGTPSPT